MTFEATAGRIHVTNQNRQTIFDTDEGLFVVTDVLNGSIVMPARSGAYYDGAGFSDANIDTDHLVGACNAAADVVRGTFEVVAGAGSGKSHTLAGLGRFNANGTYIAYHDFRTAFTRSGTGENWNGTTCCTYTFFASGGSVYVKEKSRIQADTCLAPGCSVTRTMIGATFNYDLIVGTFV